MPAAYRAPAGRPAHLPRRLEHEGVLRQPQQGGIFVGPRPKRNPSSVRSGVFRPDGAGPCLGTVFYKDSAPDGADGAHSQGELERRTLLPQSRNPLGEGEDLFREYREVVGVVREALRPGREAQIPGYPAPVRGGSRTERVGTFFLQVGTRPEGMKTRSDKVTKVFLQVSTRPERLGRRWPRVGSRGGRGRKRDPHRLQ